MNFRQVVDMILDGFLYVYIKLNSRYNEIFGD